MSKEFVRNIKNTRLRGDKKEPLSTNIQNDILSDNEDVFVRNKDEYHCLTDNIKHITSINGSIGIERKDKNTVDLRVITGPDVQPVEILITVKENSTEYLVVNEITKNHFEIGVTNDLITDLDNIKTVINNLPSNYYSKTEIDNIIASIEDVDLSDYYTKEEIDNMFNLYKPDVEVDIKSNSTRLHVNKQDTNEYLLDLDLSGYLMEGDLPVYKETIINSDTEDTLKVTRNSENNYTLANDLSKYATIEYVDDHTSSGGEFDVEQLLLTSLRYDSTNKILKEEYYNSTNRGIRLKKCEAFVTRFDDFGSTGLASRVVRFVTYEGSKQISPGYAGGNNNVLDGLFLTRFNQFYDNANGNDLMITFIVLATVDLNTQNERDVTFKFDRNVVVYPNEPPLEQ